MTYIHSELEKELGHLRLKDVLKIIPISKSTWWKWVKEGRAPKPYKLSKTVTVWKFADVLKLVDELDQDAAKPKNRG